MRVGSIIEMEKDFDWFNINAMNEQGLKYPRPNQGPFIVDGLTQDCGVTYLKIDGFFDERKGVRIGFLIDLFREIEFPPLLTTQIHEALKPRPVIEVREKEPILN